MVEVAKVWVGFPRSRATEVPEKLQSGPFCSVACKDNPKCRRDGCNKPASGTSEYCSLECQDHLEDVENCQDCGSSSSFRDLALVRAGLIGCSEASSSSSSCSHRFVTPADDGYPPVVGYTVGDDGVGRWPADAIAKYRVFWV